MSNEIKTLKPKETHSHFETKPETQKKQVSQAPSYQQLQNNLDYIKLQGQNNKIIMEQATKLQAQIMDQQARKAQYFSKISILKPSKNNSKIASYLHQITKTINKDLRIGKLIIQQNQKPFTLKITAPNQVNQQEKIRKDLQKKRQEAIQNIRQIQRQEISIRKSIISSTDKLHKSKIKRNSSLIIKPPPETQQEQFKKAIFNHRKFLKEMEQKNQSVDKQKQEMILRQFQQKEQFLKKRRQSKKVQVIQNLKSLVLREKQRKQMIQEWKQKQKQIKQKKYLYIENSMKEKEEMQQKMNQKNQFLQKLRNAHMFNKAQIQQHERQFKQILQNRKSSIYSSKISQSISEHVKYNETKFTQIVRKQLQQLKKRQIQKNTKIKDHQKKKKVQQYQKIIQEQIMPRHHLKEFVQPQRSYSLEALSAQGLRGQGLKNLQKAKKLKKSQSELKFFLLKKQSQQKLRIAKTKDIYKDYLQQIKKGIKYDPSERELKKLLQKNRKRTHSDFQSLAKAKYLSQYMVEKAPAFGDQKTYLAIKKKLDLLNVIY